MRRVGYLLVAAYGLSGCRGGTARDETRGELGNGVFTYLCVDSSDPICAADGRARQFPERIGVDGIFDIEFEPSRNELQSSARVFPAADGIVNEQNQLLYAAAPGRVALLARRTSDSRIVDFIHIDVREVADLRIEQGGVSPRTVWETGTLQTLTAKAIDEDRALLAGARDFTWETSDPKKLRLERANPTEAMELRPLAPGPVVITVSSGSVVVELELTIEGEPVVAPADGGSDGGGSDDGGAMPVDGALPLPDAGGEPDAPVDGGGGEEAGDAAVLDGATE